jgi:hypothetical protein
MLFNNIYIYRYINMSNYNTSSAFFKRNNCQLNIITKLSKKDKNKKNANNNLGFNKSNRVSDDDFNELMKENVEEKKNEIRFSNYLDKIKDSEIVEQLIQEQLIGKDLVCKLELEKIYGSQLLKAILKKYNVPSDYNWILPENYGLALSSVLANNMNEQLMCLLLIQDYSRSFEFPKISYKDKQVYLIKTIFQLLFTYDIIEESTFWVWQDLLTDFVDIDEDTKNKICIQTTEFFNILKITFTDEDYENGENIENIENIENKTNKQIANNHQNKLYEESDEEPDKKLDKYQVPEEQDYNIDDDNFNLDDI